MLEFSWYKKQIQQKSPQQKLQAKTTVLLQQMAGISQFKDS